MTNSSLVSGSACSALDGLIGPARSQRLEMAGRLGDAVALEGLAKTYADGTAAVRGISFRVAAGESFGILGPNGAGKSTTIGMLGTLVTPTGGRATVAGFDVVADRRARSGGAAAQGAQLPERLQLNEGD
jgi:ABC-2 type transport system ATP-binding protein